MTDLEVERLVERAIVKAFRDLGFDEADTFEVRKDLMFLREWRHTCEEVKHKGAFTMITVVVTALIGLLVLGFRGWIHG